MFLKVLITKYQNINFSPFDNFKFADYKAEFFPDKISLNSYLVLTVYGRLKRLLHVFRKKILSKKKLVLCSC